MRFPWALLLLVATTVRLVSGDDRLSMFNERLQRDDVVKCKDPTRLLPNCKECIPGLKQGRDSNTCNEFIPDSEAIRKEISTLTKERFGSNIDPKKPHGLYPYLELPDFMKRQEAFGEMISMRNNSLNIIDIGAYYNPIHLFLSPNHCPYSVIIVEPILDALSAIVPCHKHYIRHDNPHRSTHYIILPITFKYFITINQMLPKPDTVVCIGCDSHYGPSKVMLETTFERPYTLFMEYPSEYIHNKRTYKLMMGQGPGEELLFFKKFQPKTNLTEYVKRIMKVIDYTVI